MHMWGDKDFDWKGLDCAITYCMDFWRKWGRIGSHGKEKYGTFRDHVYFWDGGIWSLFYPGYVWVKPGFWSFIYYKLDYYITRPFTRYTGIARIGFWYQSQIYNYAIQKACRDYPHLINELVMGLDRYDLIKPGIFGPVCGITICKKY